MLADLLADIAVSLWWCGVWALVEEVMDDAIVVLAVDARCRLCFSSECRRGKT
jgi:hypothetical protein